MIARTSVNFPCSPDPDLDCRQFLIKKNVTHDWTWSMDFCIAIPATCFKHSQFKFLYRLSGGPSPYPSSLCWYAPEGYKSLNCMLLKMIVIVLMSQHHKKLTFSIPNAGNALSSFPSVRPITSAFAGLGMLSLPMALQSQMACLQLDCLDYTCRKSLGSKTEYWHVLHLPQLLHRLENLLQLPGFGWG